MSVLDDIYKIILTVKDEDIQLPQTPESVTISNEDKTQVETLVNGRPFTIPQLDGPQTFKFDFVITNKAYPFTFKEELKGIRFYTDLLWGIKNDREPIELTILRNHGKPDTHVTVLLKDYSYIEDSADLSDYTFSVAFVEYHPQVNQELPYRGSRERHHLLIAGENRSWSTEIKGTVGQAVGTATEEDLHKADVLESRRLEWEGLVNGTST